MKTKYLGWLALILVLGIGAAIVPIQSNFFTNPAYKQNDAATARTYLGLGNMAVPNANDTQFDISGNTMSLKSGATVTNITGTASGLQGVTDSAALHQNVNLGDVQNPTIARQNLLLGSIATENTNAFMRTNQAQVFSISNNISSIAASNMFMSNWYAISTDNRWGNMAWEAGHLYFNYPNTNGVGNYLFLNIAHGGGSDGTELQLPANLIYMGPTDGGHLQIGLGTQHRLVEYMQYAQADIGTTTPHKGQSHQFGFRYAFDIAPGYTDFAIPQWNINATNYNDLTGDAKLIVWSPATLLTTSTDVQLGTNIFAWDTHGWTEAQSYRRQHFEPSPSGTNVAISMLTDSQAWILATTSFVTLNNVFLTNMSWKGDMYLYSPFGSIPVTFPASWIWESESGLAVAPTNITGSNMMHVQINYTLGTATNIIANYKTATYTPVIDSSAAAFFTASGLTDPPTKSAINTFCISAKSHGYFTKLIAIHPFVGGNSTIDSYNLVDPTKYRFVWTGSVTHNANSVAGDGAAAYGTATGLVPSTEITSQNDCFAGVWVKSTTPTDGGYFFAVVGANNARWGMARAGGNLVNSGMNCNVNSECTASAAGNWSGFAGENRTGSTAEQDYGKSAVQCSPTGRTATSGLPTTTPYTIFARRFSDLSQDGYSNVELSGSFVGQGMTAQNVTDLMADYAVLNTALGR